MSPVRSSAVCSCNPRELRTRQHPDRPVLHRRILQRYPHRQVFQRFDRVIARILMPRKRRAALRGLRNRLIPVQSQVRSDQPDRHLHQPRPAALFSSIVKTKFRPSRLIPSRSPDSRIEASCSARSRSKSTAIRSSRPSSNIRSVRKNPTSRNCSSCPSLGIMCHILPRPASPGIGGMLSRPPCRALKSIPSL